MRGNELFKEFKGPLTEQYVLQQLMTMPEINTYYWINERGGAEIDFIIGNGRGIIPIEVKAETNLKAKSLKTYREKFNPKKSIRTAMTAGTSKILCFGIVGHYPGAIIKN